LRESNGDTTLPVDTCGDNTGDATLLANAWTGDTAGNATDNVSQFGAASGDVSGGATLA